MSTTTTVSNSKLFRVTVAVEDERLKQMKDAPQLAADVLQVGADYWHTKILPKHFSSDAHNRYGYAARSRAYVRSKRGKPDLVNSGSLRRDLKTHAQFKNSGRTVVLRMHARVLNFVPKMSESDQDLYVKHKSGRGYPNLKREIKAVVDDEREAIAAVMAAEMQHRLSLAAQPKLTGAPHGT